MAAVSVSVLPGCCWDKVDANKALRRVSLNWAFLRRSGGSPEDVEGEFLSSDFCKALISCSAEARAVDS